MQLVGLHLMEQTPKETSAVLKVQALVSQIKHGVVLFINLDLLE